VETVRGLRVENSKRDIYVYVFCVLGRKGGKEREEGREEREEGKREGTRERERERWLPTLRYHKFAVFIFIYIYFFLSLVYCESTSARIFSRTSADAMDNRRV